MRSLNRVLRTSLLAAAAALAPTPGVLADPPEGVWDAVVDYNGVELPFRIEFSGDGDDFKGAYHNGPVKVGSTGGHLKDGAFTLDFDHYLTKLEGTFKDGRIEGRFQSTSSRGGDSRLSAFHAERHAAAPASAGEAPSIGGLWEIQVESPKGEKAWRFIVDQDGADVSGSILRVDGDTGTLSGSYKDGKFVLSHFTGVRPLRVEITPQEDGSLSIQQFGRPGIGKELTAWRSADARSKGLPEPADFARHTTVKDPEKPFKFSFPDLDGKIVSSDDPRFKGKVVVAVVTGTWCPNCHDEAQYLVELYRKYRDKGLEVVALDFEEIAEQESGYKRARAFIQKYGVDYTYLLAGDPVEMWTQVPQADNLNSWPTTFFIGRDGRVDSVHSGFASPASGEFHENVKQRFAATVERLLADETATASR